MSDIAKLLAPPNEDRAPFPRHSRYFGLEAKRFIAPDGRVLRYVARRFVPAPEQHSVQALHQIQQGERLDLIAAHYFSQPTQSWKIADANGLRELLDASQERLQAGQTLVIGELSPLAGPQR